MKMLLPVPTRIPIPAFALLAGAVALSCACSSVEESASAQGEPLINLRVQFDKATYRPGEMVVASLRLLNVTDEPVVLRAPQCVRRLRDSNLNFRARRLGSEEIWRRTPIVVRGDLVAPTVRLEPAEVLEEKYGFINLTETTGAFKVFVEYTGIPLTEAAFRAGETGRPSLVSSLAEFRVAGPRALLRGASGLITKEESIRLAKAACGRPVADARAVLKKTASDLLDWWVTLRIAPEALEPGAPPCVAYYVNPYGGFVKEQAEPFSMDQAKFEALEARLRGLRAVSPGSGPRSAPAAPPPEKK